MTRKGHSGIVYYLKRFISFSLIFRGGKRTCPVSEKRNKQMTCLQCHPDIFFFSLPTNQMAVRFQTQGSGRQSRNKIAFLGRRIGLTICQIKGPTRTHIYTQTSVCFDCVSVPVCPSVSLFLGVGASCEAVRSCTEVSQSTPDGIPHCF